MFERFTDRARRVILLANEEARFLNHNYIGTEHILLGLLNEGDGIAGQALTSLGVDLDSVREEVLKIIGQGAKSPSGHIPFTPRAKKIFEFSLREALQLGHNYIGTEHILLALLREGEGVGAQVLVARGVDFDTAKARVLELLGPNRAAISFESVETLVDRTVEKPRRGGGVRLGLIAFGVIIVSLVGGDRDNIWTISGLVMLGLALLVATAGYLNGLVNRSASRSFDVTFSLVLVAAAFLFLIGALL